MEPAAVVEPVSQVVEALRGLHPSVHGVVGIVLIAGLILWMWGRRVLKPMTVLLFGMLGAYIAFFVIPTTALSAELGVSVSIWLLIGLAFGALAGMLVYRSAMAVGFGLVLALVAPAGASVVLDWRGASGGGSGLIAQGPDQVGVDGAEPALVDLDVGELGEAVAGLGSVEGDAAGMRTVADAANHTRAFLRAVGGELELFWDGLDAERRVVFSTAALAGLGLGVMVGLVLPGWAAGAVTSMTGAALWLPAGVWLMNAYDVMGRGALASLETRSWLVVWAVASVVGVLLQWRAAEARTGISEDDPDDDD